jgi:hypothetical protein
MKININNTETKTNENATTYYVIETNYVGPNALYDPDTIGIYTRPAYGNMSQQPVVDGWAGTTNDWATYAHGEFDSIDEARAKIAELYPERREVDEYDDYENVIVELYKPGKYAIMTREDTADWLYEDMRELTGKESDEKLEEIIGNAESNANDNGCTLHSDAFSILADERDRAKAENED